MIRAVVTPTQHRSDRTFSRSSSTRSPSAFTSAAIEKYLLQDLQYALMSLHVGVSRSFSTLQRGQVRMRLVSFSAIVPPGSPPLHIITQRPRIAPAGGDAISPASPALPGPSCTRSSGRSPAPRRGSPRCPGWCDRRPAPVESADAAHRRTGVPRGPGAPRPSR